MTNQEAISRLSGEFCDNALERDYREGRAQQETAQIRLIWLLALLFFCAYGAVDVFLQNRGLALFQHRVLILLAGGLAIWLSPRLTRYTHRDALHSLALLMVCFCYVDLLRLRASPANPQGAILLLVIGIYAFSPARFRLALMCGVLCTLMFWISVGTQLGKIGGWVAHSYLVPANLLAALALSRLNRANRYLYLQQLKLLREQSRSRDLLYNTLPYSVARQLERQPHHLPYRQADQASVVFADLVNFSDLGRRHSSRRLLALLN